MLNTVSKLRGQVKTTGYPQTEGLLGDCMLKYGKELGEDSTFGEHERVTWPGRGWAQDGLRTFCFKTWQVSHVN
jgi:hypothetical protein